MEAPAFTDAIRMYRQSREQYGTWDMLCGNETQVSSAPPPRLGRAAGGRAGSPKHLLPPQILSNLVMEELLPELRSAIGPRLKGKAPERQRTWIQVWGWGGTPLPAHPAWGAPRFPAGLLCPSSPGHFPHSGFLKLFPCPCPAPPGAASLGLGGRTGGSPAPERSPSWLNLASHF